MSTSIKRERQRTIRELVGGGFVGSQEELAAALRDRGFGVTQATISRDVADLGLVRIARGDRHLYLTPEEMEMPAATGSPTRLGDDARLRRILSDIPVHLGRSGLTVLVIGSAGTANILAQAIDESSLDEQEGTVAGDNTVLVLFATEGALLRWLERFVGYAEQVSLSPAIARSLPAGATGAGTNGATARPSSPAPVASLVASEARR